ncbi:MAG TPA: site-specific integrase [Candidatus Angelobacter sp.]|jgi:integrase
MAGKKVSYAKGSIALNKRASGEHVWVFRYKDSSGKYRGIQFATIKQCRTRTHAKNEAEKQHLRQRYLEPARLGRKTLGDAITRYKKEVMPERFSTQHGYSSWLKLHISEWASSVMEDMDPAAVELWLKGRDLAPKSKSSIKGLMAILFDQAMKWKWLPIGRNPMALVKITGGTKRKSRPGVLTQAQFGNLLTNIGEQHVRVVVIVGMCLGLRLSEILALQWSDIDWEDMSLSVERGIVNGRLGPVKTEYSDAPAPVDPALLEILLGWKRTTEFAGDGDWIFASPFKCGRAPYFPTAIRRKIHAAARLAGLDKLLKGEPTKILRHTYRSWLGTTNAPLAVIKDLMRHADIRTTMNVYGNGLEAPMRGANSKVVKMVLKTRLTPRVKSVSYK